MAKGAPGCEIQRRPAHALPFSPLARAFGRRSETVTVRGSFLTKLPTHTARLDNGLTVLIREDHSAPVVAIVTHVKAGYFNEPDALVGISHVLEHMYFKGTERRGVGSLARETRAAGGYLNAGTIYDYTSYYTVLPAPALELGLDIQADALRNSKIDEGELERELQVIIQEAKRKLDNPSAVAAEALYEEMFDVHRMRRWRIGTEEGLARLTRSEVLAYYRNLYRPANIIVVVVGDVDTARTLELVQRHYGDMPPGEPVHETSPEEPERRGFRLREQSGEILQTYLELGWRTPGSLHPDTPALDMLATVLGQGRASRLYQGVRERGLVSSIGAYNYTPTQVGVFGISAELRPEDTRGAVEAIWRETLGMIQGAVLDSELERARHMLEARMIRRHETAEGQAKLLADWQALGDWQLARDYFEQLLAVDPAELRRVATQYLELDLATILVYRPNTSAPVAWAAQEAAAELATLAPATPSVPALALPPLPQPIAATPRRLGVEDEVHAFELPNGIRVWIKTRRTSPLVAATLAVRGGVGAEDRPRAGITGFMSRLSLKGSPTRSASQLALATESLGGVLTPSVAPDAFGWSITIPSHHFAEGIALLADAALRPAFPQPELERERRLALNDLEQLRDDMFRYPLHLFLHAAFGGHPYGFPVAAIETSLNGVDRQQLVDWHHQQVRAGGPSVLVVGDVDPEQAAAIIAHQLEGVGTDRVLVPSSPAGWPTSARSEVEHLAKAQTALALGFPAPPRSDPDVIALQLLSSLASGLGGRFFDELRERRSLAYTVTTVAITRQAAGAFVAYIATSPDREDEARQGLIEQFQRLASDIVQPEELQRAQEYVVGARKIRSQTNAAQLGDLTDALLLGDGLRELREFEERVRGVTPQYLRDLVQRYFDPDRLVEGVVRGTGGGR
jgi:zinc protease